MSTLSELQQKYQEAQQKIAYYQDVLALLQKQRDLGEMTQSDYEGEAAAVKLYISQWRSTADKYLAAINAWDQKDAAEKDAEDRSGDAKTAEELAREAELADKQNAAAAATWYSRAEALYQRYLNQQITENTFMSQLRTINDALNNIGWPAWKVPTPVAAAPAAPAAGEVTVDLGPITELLGEQSNLTAMVLSSDIGKQLEEAATQGLKQAGFTDNLATEAARSPVDPAKAAEYAKAISLSILGGVALAGSAVILAEAGSLGQLETPGRVMQMIFGATGADQLAAKLSMIPFETGIVRGAERHWNSINQAELPGSGDLIRFLVRETITRGVFDKAMREQGYSPQWTNAYWTSHWREIARRDVMDAYHRNKISASERDKLLVILDFRPDARPGISKSDLDIVGSIGKELIGRVDLRRAYKLGLLDFEELVKRYGWLGYEEDSEQMAFVMANTAFEAAQNSVIRVLGQRYALGQITRNDFLGAIRHVRGVFDDEQLWLARYEQSRQLALGKEEEERTSAEEASQESEELTEGP